MALDDLVDHNIKLEAQALVFPHHGGKSNDFDSVRFTHEICDLVRPATILFSIGRKKYRNPRQEVVAAIRAALGNVRLSCTQLSEQCAKSLPANDPTHLADVFSNGYQDPACCGGAFMIRLARSVDHFPLMAEHKDFIQKKTVKPLCR